MFFLDFLAWLFKKGKTIACYILIFFSSELLFFLMKITLKYFHDGLNIVMTLAPGSDFFSAKCAQFPLTFNE